MNLIQVLAMKLDQGPVFIDGRLNSTKVVVYSKTNFLKVVRNFLLLRKLLMLCAVLTYREIEINLGVSGTSKHEHFTVKKFCSRWIPHNLSIAQRNQSIRVAKMLRQLVQKHANVYRS